MNTFHCAHRPVGEKLDTPQQEYLPSAVITALIVTEQLDSANFFFFKWTHHYIVVPPFIVVICFLVYFSSRSSFVIDFCLYFIIVFDMYVRARVSVFVCVVLVWVCERACLSLCVLC